jgi:hypothetical protein
MKEDRRKMSIGMRDSLKGSRCAMQGGGEARREREAARLVERRVVLWTPEEVSSVGSLIGRFVRDRKVRLMKTYRQTFI